MFSCAPKYIQDSGDVVEAFSDSFANNFIVPIKSMIKAGVRVSYEADRDTYVWEDLELAMVRKDLKGKVWGAHERIDKTEALKLATIWAADYVLKPDKLGSIETGKLADLVVLDRDYMTIPAEEVSEIQPQLTIFDGKIVFAHTAFSNEYNLKPDGAVISTFKDLKARRRARAEELVGEGGG
jgi:predicted amidohydrolase YtcJ